MSRARNFKPNTGIEAKAARALFGDLNDPRGQQIFSTVALWPDSERKLSDSVGNYAKIARWTTKRNGRRQQFIEARIHPAVDAVLDILVPALCQRDATPFKLFANAIEATKSAKFPDLPVALHALNIACELGGYAPPFNLTGERSAAESDEISDEPAELKRLPDEITSLKVPVIESEFLRRVAARSKQAIDPGRFNRLCRDLNITCAKDPRKGGRRREQ